MGWKSSIILVNTDIEVNEIELLERLGFNKIKATEKESFEVAIHPNDNQVYIGRYKGNLIICTQELPLTFLEETISKGEKELASYFPNTEICSLVLHSVVNLWGYAISKNGHKMRVRAGSSEDGTFAEYGEPLEEELELLSKSKIDENGNRVYQLDDFPNEVFEEDQVGENFVFNISKRYFGERLDAADDLLFETELNGYSVNTSSLSRRENTNQERKPNKWVIYLLIAAAIIIFRILRKTFFSD
ncbi:hypothetical protein FEE95_00285 [Maribacter algarum]|uniref:Uncharacterized protein n=1 Tax=Maribacter algarum (ex Zhang et al. 2020) TaxID=2578118 RepID=A0A5S3PSC1_9FLAO|nr:hypothetical protein [Maribacter algarum]TMM57906.1 hypothetical protein FEE95_00285 [Maribacter algarum]